MRDDDAGISADVTGWASGAPEWQRDAHARTLVWSIAVQRQVRRVRQARLDAMSEGERTRHRGVYDAESAEPFHRMQAEIFLALTAANQLLRSLDRFDGDRRPSEGLKASQLKRLRNALEHWDGEPEEGEDPGEKTRHWSIRELMKAGVDPNDNRWREDGTGVIGDVDDRELEAWAEAVYDDVISWNPR